MTETEIIHANAESVRLISRGVVKLVQRGESPVEVIACLATVLTNFTESVMQHKTQDERIAFLVGIFQATVRETIQ